MTQVCPAGYKDCAVRQYSGSRSSDPEEVRKRAMNDPEVQQIMSDPAMRMILEQMQSDPQAVQVRNLINICGNNFHDI